MRIPNHDRDLAILSLRMAGKTYRECGAQFGITGSRVRQICIRQAFREGIDVAEKMAEHGDPRSEICDAVRKYVVAGLISDSFLPTIVNNALKKAGRYKDVPFESGFWCRWKNRERGDMQHLLRSVPAVIGRKTVMVYANDFLHGVCGIFALALHDQFGYPINALQWIYDGDDDTPSDSVWDGLVHIFCPVSVFDQDGWVDVRGITTNWDEFCKEFDDPSAMRVYTDVDPAVLRADLLRDIDIQSFEAFYAKAIGLIKAWYQAYDVAAVR